MDLIKKIMPCTLIEKAAGKPLVALVSTPGADYVGDIIMPMPNEKGGGWMVEEFNRRGGRINWMHDTLTRPNLAKARAIPSVEGLLLEVQFDLHDKKGATLDRKYREGYLDEWSVSFHGVAGRSEPNNKGGITFWESRLFEVSAVNAGMNPETETLAKSFVDLGRRLAAVEAAVLAKPADDAADAKELIEELANFRAALVREQRN